jgi:MULE transposase domain
LLSQILGVIARTTLRIKYKILTCDTSNDTVKVFKSIVGAYGPCIEEFIYLTPIIIIDAGFLSGHYEGRLLMAYVYDAKNNLIPLAFRIMDEENIKKWGWFIWWVRNEVNQYNTKICIIFDYNKGIKEIFDRPHLRWSEQHGEAIHRYCMQYIVENLYKEVGKYGQKEQNLKDDFKCRLANKKKLHHFIEKWRKLRKSNKIAYEFLKKIRKGRETTRMNLLI